MQGETRSQLCFAVRCGDWLLLTLTGWRRKTLVLCGCACACRCLRLRLRLRLRVCLPVPVPSWSWLGQGEQDDKAENFRRPQVEPGCSAAASAQRPTSSWQARHGFTLLSGAGKWKERHELKVLGRNKEAWELGIRSIRRQQATSGPLPGSTSSSVAVALGHSSPAPYTQQRCGPWSSAPARSASPLPLERAFHRPNRQFDSSARAISQGAAASSCSHTIPYHIIPYHTSIPYQPPTLTPTPTPTPTLLAPNR